jgi:tRNA-2-methylthio-N6-dimethylallyladenosine synthase
MKKIYLETFGCQMNVLDSELIEGRLRTLGYDFTGDWTAADIVLYNTCSVRQHSEDKVLSRLGLLKIRKQSQPDLVVGVLGCMAERNGLRLGQHWPQVDVLCGPGELDKLPALLDNAFRTGKQQTALAGNTGAAGRRDVPAASGDSSLELLDLSRSFSPQKNRFQAYIRVVRGCNKFCTYCVVPYTRGPEVSRAPQAIIDEARRLVDAGAMEITLLGQTINHYVYEHGTASGAAGAVRRRTTFAELLYQLHESIPHLPRLRFLTSFPADFTDDILHVLAGCSRICRYLHIPAQAGSNRILRLMNRGYTVESYLALVERARRLVPDIALAGDFIVGFPTETEEDYQATRDLVSRVRYKNCFIFKYSPRPGTVAARRHPDDVSELEKRRRNNDLLTVQNQISQELNRTLIGQSVQVLCEGPSGWNRSAESVITQRTVPDETAAVAAFPPAPRVELGRRLAAAMRAPVGRQAAGAPPPIAPGAIQLMGRTTADQIVVFDGAPSLEGRMVQVRIHTAHAMTIFARLEREYSAEQERRPSVPST